MRNIEEPIQVEANHRGEPLSFVWRRQKYVVTSTVTAWRWAGKWWLTGVAQRRHYFRVEAAPRGQASRVIELYREEDEWHMSAVLD